MLMYYVFVKFYGWYPRVCWNDRFYISLYINQILPASSVCFQYSNEDSYTILMIISL
jgi:hypothetical protein